MACMVVGCSARPSSAKQNGRIINYTQCTLPRDQGRGSFQGNWAALPVPLVFDKDFYLTDSGEAVDALRGAANSWNRWSNIRGFSAFRIINDGSGISAGQDIPELTDCTQASYSAAVTDRVGLWKIASSGHRANKRDSCGAQQRILPTGVQGQTDWIIQNNKIAVASILLNFEEFNAPGKQKIDVESLTLHELGHVLGLLHSCNGSTDEATDTTSSPPCFDAFNRPSAPASYMTAVMFPFLRGGEVRRALGENDYARINCIY